jgi:hypothetical protein
VAGAQELGLEGRRAVRPPLPLDLIQGRGGATPRPELERHEPLPGITAVPAWLRRHVSRRGRRLLLAGVAALAVIVAVAIPITERASDRRDARAAREVRARAAAREAELRRVQRPHGATVSADRGDRLALVRGLESRVLADARERHRAGELPDRVSKVRCAPFTAGTAPRRPGVAILECVALTPGATGRLATGYPFRARVEVAPGTMAWCRNVLPPAHPDEPHQVSVGLSPRCTGERPISR